MKNASLGSRRCPSKSIQDRIPRLRRLLQKFVHLRYVLLLQSYQKIERGFHSLHFAEMAFMPKTQHTRHQIRPVGARHVHLSESIIVDVFNCFPNWWPILQEINILLRGDPILWPFALRVLLILSRRPSIYLWHSLHINTSSFSTASSPSFYHSEFFSLLSTTLVFISLGTLNCVQE